MSFLLELDYTLFHWINAKFTHPWLDSFFVFITDLHKTSGFALIYLGLGFGAYFYKYKKRGLYYFLMSLLSVALTDASATYLIKKNFERRRPFKVEHVESVLRSRAHGSSFVSNHATNTFGLALFHSSYFPRSKVILFTFAALVAYSRVYNGVHFPIDVVAGALWGLLISYLMLRIARKLEAQIFKTHSPESPK